MKRIVVIGNGTAGMLTVMHYLKWADNSEIDLYFDPSIKPQSVGEGANLILPKNLGECLSFTYTDLENINGTLKYGIKKSGWTEKEYTHHFLPGNVSYHFSAVELQNFILSTIKNRINIVEKNVNSSDIDADLIIDCSGTPKNYDDFYMSECIPVNSVYVTPCYWDVPRFNYTLTIARPYGWVFGIPLKNRCSIGYMYNHNINNLEEIKEDVKNVFTQYNLIPGSETNQFNFKNYYRKTNFTERVAYNGNCSFFLEPMEATSISTMDIIQRLTFDVHFLGMPIEIANKRYLEVIDEIENVIMLHYLTGSTYDTNFWDFAKHRAEKKLSSAMKDSKFVKMISPGMEENTFAYGSWGYPSFQENIKGLGIYDRLLKLI